MEVKEDKTTVTITLNKNEHEAVLIFSENDLSFLETKEYKVGEVIPHSIAIAETITKMLMNERKKFIGFIENNFSKFHELHPVQ